MEVLILGGFLGSGKTTLLNKLLRGLDQEGHTAAVIENELGAVGIDSALVGGADLVVVNKVDAAACTQEALARMRTLSGGAPSLTISARDLSPGEVWQAIREGLS